MKPRSEKSVWDHAKGVFKPVRMGITIAVSNELVADAGPGIMPEIRAELALMETMPPDYGANRALWGSWRKGFREMFRDRPGRLFRAFSKSSAEAADSVSGVGLGLALSRRLARSMGGDLRLDPGAAGGACFALLLRQA